MSIQPQAVSDEEQQTNAPSAFLPDTTDGATPPQTPYSWAHSLGSRERGVWSDNVRNRDVHEDDLHRESVKTDADAYDHFRGRSTAATRFNPDDVDGQDKKSRFRRLKRWNDGTRDTDRQKVELRQDCRTWVDSYGSKLGLPYDVIESARQRLSDLDLRELGLYNGVHRAALTSLVLEYKHHLLRERYRESERHGEIPWHEREDICRLREGLDMSESELRGAISTMHQKTSVK